MALVQQGHGQITTLWMQFDNRVCNQTELVCCNLDATGVTTPRVMTRSRSQPRYVCELGPAKPGHNVQTEASHSQPPRFGTNHRRCELPPKPTRPDRATAPPGHNKTASPESGVRKHPAHPWPGYGIAATPGSGVWCTRPEEPNPAQWPRNKPHKPASRPGSAIVSMPPQTPD